MRGENSPAVPLAFMAAHTVCSLGEEAALQNGKRSLTANIHGPMRHLLTAKACLQSVACLGEGSHNSREALIMHLDLMSTH